MEKMKIRIWVFMLYCKLPFRKLICLFKGHDELIRLITNKGCSFRFNGYFCPRCHKEWNLLDT